MRIYDPHAHVQVKVDDLPCLAPVGPFTPVRSSTGQWFGLDFYANRSYRLDRAGEIGEALRLRLQAVTLLHETTGALLDRLRVIRETGIQPVTARAAPELVGLDEAKSAAVALGFTDSEISYALATLGEEPSTEEMLSGVEIIRISDLRGEDEQ